MSNPDKISNLLSRLIKERKHFTIAKSLLKYASSEQLTNYLDYLIENYNDKKNDKWINLILSFKPTIDIQILCKYGYCQSLQHMINKDKLSIDYCHFEIAIINDHYDIIHLLIENGYTMDLMSLITMCVSNSKSYDTFNEILSKRKLADNILQ